ncbi:uncharacterized protein LOC129318417 isoform X3 [Prosopis cineraria]|uniref:uncharacterized protein LOC129318417 isoform X3 n=1 Tax=Prosopis cineraria TaxID=364024 RepID=UPI00241031FD|nr:uncharacterized protein LOC129318417 isoform X3 [Prosopis cineraria]
MMAVSIARPFSQNYRGPKFGGIYKAHELKYVIGKCHDECLSNENENKELHIDLPALETLSLVDVPNMMSICVKNYQLERTSQQIMEAPKAETYHSYSTSIQQITVEIVNVVEDDSNDHHQVNQIAPFPKN